MIYEERLLKVLHAPHTSEKASKVTENNNTIVLKVSINTNKPEIKSFVNKIFEVKACSIRTLIIKGKTKLQKKHIGRRSNWKKAYVTLQKGQNLDFINEPKYS